MSQIERIRVLLEDRGIEPELKENGTELVMMISTGAVSSRMVISEHRTVLGASILLPIFTPVGRRNEMAIAILKANWALIGGSFRMDTDGELRYECFLPVLDAEPTERQLLWLIHGAWTISSRYSTAFMEVAFSTVNPEEAINKVEASWQNENRELPVM